MSRRVISVHEALVFIFGDTLEGDLGELSDEDRPCSVDELDKEQDLEVDNDGPPSLKRRLVVGIADSLPTDFSMPIRQNTQVQHDLVVLDSSEISTAFEVSIGAEPVSEVSDALCDTTGSSSFGEVSSSFLFGDLPVDQCEEDCATIAMQSGVPISHDPVLIDSEESIQL